MSATYAEKEREFISGLAEDTGKDLAGWMNAIAQSGHTERNEIIDWLRHQGFQFSWASWLERIHHNGGRLIYGDDSSAARIQPRSTAIRDLVDEEPPSRQRLVVTPSSPAPPDKTVQGLLTEAKGLRPLAEHILREVGRVRPDTRFEVAGPLVMMSAAKPFAALHPAPKRIRLYANFGLEAARSKPSETINKSPPPFSQMLVLDDVRSIDEEFRRMIRAASAR
ncbi:DUF5655 domain-containing protein [Hyphomicrobium sp.]|uniref:DUF5655 domain-containing protein n=1 Tax=Hyphomicrobium sp. TaxID=82 RepID=UPI000FA5E99C|nr:DUF5655 domain-containing protein [Hyphomicrobium sp.]RUP00676.1 MAG: hypothetical protein EKK30_01055 [Hyphomicrobium sp.]